MINLISLVGMRMLWFQSHFPTFFTRRLLFQSVHYINTHNFGSLELQFFTWTQYEPPKFIENEFCQFREAEKRRSDEKQHKNTKQIRKNSIRLLGIYLYCFIVSDILTQTLEVEDQQQHIWVAEMWR